jgi:hypothetical protein
MISSALASAHPVRPSRNERRYSTTWKRTTQRGDSRGSSTLPRDTRAPFAARITPPLATTFAGSSTKGRATWTRASGSSSESASTMQTSGWRATLRPAFSASERRPTLVLRTTVSGSPVVARCTERTSPSTGSAAVGRAVTWTRPKRSATLAKVRSVDPSSTSTTSSTG